MLIASGEKSYSTICLLLALWNAMFSPFRVLDEFDVFMDAVNRRLAMNLLIDTARDGSNSQFILITPQNMADVRVGPDIQVHKLVDPERGQRRLNFAQSQRQQQPEAVE